VRSGPRAWWAAASLSFLLAACAGIPRGGQISSVNPAVVTSFELSGRINVRVEKDAYPGRVRWQHTARTDELWFYSPLGTTVAHLRQDETGARLVNSDGHEYRAANLRELTNQILGWDLPLEALPFWVRGVEWPEAAKPTEAFDDRGQLKSLNQAGWEVTYLDWAPAGVKGLPSKLDLQGEHLRMRLLIEKWQVSTDVQ
jgi:outer membrane lipoprotein LolB